MHILIIGLGCGFGGYAGYHMLNSALSDTLCLNNLRHGTSPKNWIGIQINGARPDYGGKKPGEAQLEGYAGNGVTENKFFVWRDEFHKKGNVNHPSAFVTGLLNCKLLHPLVKRLGPKYYSALSGCASFDCKSAPSPVRVALKAVGGVVGFLTPTIDFHCTPEKEQKRFVTDPNMEPVAIYTSKKLKSYKYIGLSGILCQGINKEVFQRIKSDPTKFIRGIAKLLLLTVLVLSIISFISTYGHVAGVINFYAIICQSAGAISIVVPLTISGSVIIPFTCLVIS